MRRLRYSVPYIAGKSLPKDSDPAPRGAGLSEVSIRPLTRDFNPPAPCGAGPRGRYAPIQHRYFNPPAPCGAGQRVPQKRCDNLIFQSTRPLRGGTVSAIMCRITVSISIHPPLAGRDHHFRNEHTVVGISIHPPLAGRDMAARSKGRAVFLFQSTRPLRGGTLCAQIAEQIGRFQSTRPLRGGTLAQV